MAIALPEAPEEQVPDGALQFPLVPRPYQVEGIAALIEHKRFLLADPPSAGKTLQASEAAQQVTPSDKQILVIVGRKYLGPQWAEFLRQQYPNDKVNLAKGTILQQAQAIAFPARWVIINIEMMRTWTIPENVFGTVIVDESHHVRKASSKQSQAVNKLVNTEHQRRSSTEPAVYPIPYVFLLSATPIFKEADDLYYQLHILDPVAFPSFYSFVDRFCAFASSDYGSIASTTTDSQNITLLQRVLSQYGWIRSWVELGQTLPKMPSSVHYIDLDARRKKIYAEVRDTWKLSTSNGETLTASTAMQAAEELRHITASETKIEAIKDLIEDSQLPTIVFTWYRDSAFRMATALKCPCITGAMSDRQRTLISKGTEPVIVATIASINEGIDLSRLHQVAFMEEDWCPGNVFQALSRVRRLGADHPINLHYFLCRATIDTIIHRRLRARDTSIESITKAALLQNDGETERNI